MSEELRMKQFTNHTLVELDPNSMDAKKLWQLKKQLGSEGPFLVCAVENIPLAAGLPYKQHIMLDVKGETRPMEGKFFRRYRGKA